MADRDRPLYAVLIDADNIPAKHADAILKEVTTFGEPALRRVYGDWSSGRLNAWTKAVRELGLVAHQESANTVGKNASVHAIAVRPNTSISAGRSVRLPRLHASVRRVAA